MAKPSIVPVDEERRMTVIEHLEELRRVLIISLIAWALATVIGFAVSQWTLGILLGPVHKVIGCQKLIYPGPVDAFLLFFKIGIFTGFVLSSPIILWQVWTFVGPGLHRNERRFAVGFVSSAVALFAMGIGFAFFAMPIALRFLIGFGSSEIQYLPLASSYINFVLILIAIFGVTFELPLAMTMLGLAGIVSARTLSSQRFKFWIGIFAGAAMVTPGVDPVTPTLLAGAVIILVEISNPGSRAPRR